MRFSIRRVIGILVFGANAALAAPPAPVAIISDATGSAYAMGATGAVRVTLLSGLLPGQVLQLDPGSRVVVSFLPSGSVYELVGAGRFQVGTSSIEPLDSKNVPRKREAPAPTSYLAAQAGVRSGMSADYAALMPRYSM